MGGGRDALIGGNVYMGSGLENQGGDLAPACWIMPNGVFV